MSTVQKTPSLWFQWWTAVKKPHSDNTNSMRKYILTHLRTTPLSKEVKTQAQMNYLVYLIGIKPIYSSIETRMDKLASSDSVNTAAINYLKIFSKHNLYKSKALQTDITNLKKSLSKTPFQINQKTSESFLKKIANATPYHLIGCSFALLGPFVGGKTISKTFNSNSR